MTPGAYWTGDGRFALRRENVDGEKKKRGWWA